MEEYQCKKEEESLEHLFLLCPWTSPLWFGLQICQVPIFLSISSIFVWLEGFVISISNSEPNARANVSVSPNVHPSFSNVITTCRWIPPVSGCVKFNVDATFIVNTGRACTGSIGRDERGTFITGLSKKFFAASALMAETLALRDVVTFASALQLQTVIIESDCLIAIDACKGKWLEKKLRILLLIFRV